MSYGTSPTIDAWSCHMTYHLPLMHGHFIWYITYYRCMIMSYDTLVHGKTIHHLFTFIVLNFFCLIPVYCHLVWFHVVNHLSPSVSLLFTTLVLLTLIVLCSCESHLAVPVHLKERENSEVLQSQRVQACWGIFSLQAKEHHGWYHCERKGLRRAVSVSRKRLDAPVRVGHPRSVCLHHRRQEAQVRSGWSGCEAQRRQRERRGA